MKINRNFDNLVPNYLFADVARKTAEYAAANPDKKIIRLGIGDVTLPLAPVVVEAMKQGAEELAHKETFKGYPEYEGYDFLREAISGYYKSFGVNVSPDEIFVSDGAKSDCGNIGDIFSQDNTVLVTDPVYPVYVDSNIMAGRKIVARRSHMNSSGRGSITPTKPTRSFCTTRRMRRLSQRICRVRSSQSRVREPARSSFALFQRRQALPAPAAATRSSRRSLSATVTTFTQHGTAVRRPSSTAFHIPFSAPRQRCSATRDSVRYVRISPIIRRTRESSRPLSTSLAFTTPAARIRRTSGLNARTEWAAGSFSTCS